MGALFIASSASTHPPTAHPPTADPLAAVGALYIAPAASSVSAPGGKKPETSGRDAILRVHREYGAVYSPY